MCVMPPRARVYSPHVCTALTSALPPYLYCPTYVLPLMCTAITCVQSLCVYCPHVCVCTAPTCVLPSRVYCIAMGHYKVTPLMRDDGHGHARNGKVTKRHVRYQVRYPLMCFMEGF